MLKSEVPLAEQPAKRGARLIALRRLREAERAFTKAVQGDAVALHHFRVAMRRTRTVLRLHRPWLEESISRKRERRLRRLTRVSNKARDYAVFIDFMNKLELHDIAQSMFARGQRRSLEKFRKVAVAEFPPLARAMKRDLAHYSISVKPSRKDQQKFGSAGAELALLITQQLSDQLAAVTTIDQRDEAHAARITAKRLRYLLEPFAREIEACTAAVATLKTLQDDLGQLRDWQALNVEVERRLADQTYAGDSRIPEALRAITEAATKSFERAAARYFSSGGGHVAKSAVAAATELRARARGDVEIERKYLLSSMPRLRGAKRLEIMQGYLPGAAIRERVRAVASQDGKKKYFRAIKAGTGMVRREVEEEINYELFKQLWRLTRGRRIRKRRYVVDGENGSWVVDKFKDRHLYLAEIELAEKSSQIVIPRWLSNIIVADVTDDENYTNYALAR